MPRFFAEITQYPVAVVRDRASVHHIARVLRMAAGDAIRVRTLDDGYRARITAVERFRVWLEITGRDPLEDRTAVRVHLGLCLCDFRDWELALRLVTELGVSNVHPVVAERSPVRVVSRERMGRWHAIVMEAVKQCGRRTIPIVHEPVCLGELAERAAAGWPVRLLAHPDAEIPLEPYGGPEVGVVVGPEGGLTPPETAGLLEAGFTAVTMGRTTLRTVTAAAAVVGILGQGGVTPRQA